MNGTWRDKVSAGFMNSGAKADDKMHTLTSLSVFAAQHHMHWVTWDWALAGTARPVARTTSAGSASGWARARRPTSTPTRIRCIPPMSGRAIISAGGWRR
jgi:hypothetical protein